MIFHEETLYVVKLTPLELAMLRDLLKEAAQTAQELGREWEELRMGLLYAIAQREEIR